MVEQGKKCILWFFFTACHFITLASQDLGHQSQKDLVLEEKDVNVELYNKKKFKKKTFWKNLSQDINFGKIALNFYFDLES